MKSTLGSDRSFRATLYMESVVSLCRLDFFFFLFILFSVYVLGSNSVKTYCGNFILKACTKKIFFSLITNLKL